MKVKSIVFFVISIIVLSTCRREEFEIVNLNNNQISVYGHAGMGVGQNYPANSLESILKCLNSGADGSEMDVQVTKDGVLVAYHYEFLEKDTDGEGIIINHTWEELKDLTYNHPSIKNYSLFRLEDLFSQRDNFDGIVFTLDCKIFSSNVDPTAFYELYVGAVDKMIDKYSLINNVHIECPDTNFLARFQATGKDYKLYVYPQTFEEGFETAKKMNLTGITISSSKVSKAQIQEAHDCDLQVAVWNLHTKKQNIEAIRKNPDIIQTDKVNYLVRLLK